MCKIDEPVTWTEERLGKSYDKTAFKYEKISCHTGRRTFATLAHEAGISNLKIMLITGHKTETNFLRYIKINKKENAQKLAKDPFFSQMRIAK